MKRISFSTMPSHRAMATPDGLLIVDKPGGWTSHDVVARCRRLAATRRVGHAGTLDPMATGVLVIGIGRATRLMGHLALAGKAYDATIRLGQSTLTDDAEGEVVAVGDASGLVDADLEVAVSHFRGELRQVPSAVSAIKVKGQRAYARVRAGEAVELSPRPVTVTDFVIEDVRRLESLVDLDVKVECSTGTYVRALARDLGAELGVGGHLTALRRTRVGSWEIGLAHTLEELAGCEPEELPIVTLDVAAQEHFAWYVVEDDQVEAVRNGRALKMRLRGGSERVELVGVGPHFEPHQRGGPGATPGPVAVLAPGGRFLALYEQHGPLAKPLAVFAPAP